MPAGISAGEVTVDVKPAMGDFASKVTSGMGGVTKKLSAGLTKTGKALTIGATLPIVAFGTAAFNAFQEARKVSAQTEAVIKSTGGAAGVTAKQVSGLAEAISKKTGIDDEAIQSGQNMLLTFTNIKNEAGKGNDIFNQSTQTLVDMAAAMGTDAKSGAIQLGKALNDPIKGIGSLSRVGVTFTDQQKEQIKTMVEAGDTAGAQKVILAELTKEFGGSAAAQATAADKARVSMGNLAETVGEILTPIIEKVSGFVSGLADKFKALDPEQKKMIVTALAIFAAVGPLLLILGKFVSMLKTIGVVAKFLVASPLGLLIAVVALIILNWKTVGPFFKELWAVIKDIFKVAWNVLKVALAPLLAVAGVIIDNWSGIVAFFEGVWKGIVAAFRVAARTIMTILRPIIEAVKAIQGAIGIIGGGVKVPDEWANQIGGAAAAGNSANPPGGGTKTDRIFSPPSTSDIGKTFGPGGSGGGPMTVTGTLSITPDGKAVIRGMARSVADADRRYAGRR